MGCGSKPHTEYYYNPFQTQKSWLRINAFVLSENETSNPMNRCIREPYPDSFIAFMRGESFNLGQFDSGWATQFSAVLIMLILI
jgi:hypothetical protein